MPWGKGKCQHPPRCLYPSSRGKCCKKVHELQWRDGRRDHDTICPMHLPRDAELDLLTEMWLLSFLEPTGSEWGRAEGMFPCHSSPGTYPTRKETSLGFSQNDPVVHLTLTWARTSSCQSTDYPWITVSSARISQFHNLPSPGRHWRFNPSWDSKSRRD